MTRRAGLIVKTETETGIIENRDDWEGGLKLIKAKLNLRLFVAGNEISLIDLRMCHRVRNPRK